MNIKIPTEAFKPHPWGVNFLSAFDSGLYRYFVINWHRRARKTTHGLNLLIREACKRENEVYLYVAPTFKMAKNIIWRDPNMLDRYLPQPPILKHKSETELVLEFDTGSLVVIDGSDRPDRLRGIDCQGVLFDEYSLCKPMVWNEIFRPIIAQKSDRWAAFSFTPKGMNHAYQLWKLAKDNPSWYTMELRASESGLIPGELLEEAKKEMPVELYQQEFECKFLSDEISLFAGVMRCISGQLLGPIPGITYIGGIDLAKSHDYNVVSLINKDTKHLDFFDRWNKTSWNYTKERIINISKKYNNPLFLIDATGVGDPIVEDLIRAGVNVWCANEKEFEGFKMNNINKRQIIEKLMISFDQGLISIPRVDVLIDELLTYQIEVTPSGKITYNAPEGFYDDSVISLALANWGLFGGLYDVKTEEKPLTQAELFWKRVHKDLDRYKDEDEKVYEYEDAQEVV